MLIFRPLRFLPSEVKSLHSLIPQLISMSASFKNMKEALKHWKLEGHQSQCTSSFSPASVSTSFCVVLVTSDSWPTKETRTWFDFWGIVIKLFLEKSPNSFLSPDSLCPPENFGQRSALASHHHWGLWGFWGLCRWLTCCRAKPCDVQLLN